MEGALGRCETLSLSSSDSDVALLLLDACLEVSF
jgi:hypothetical protein